MQTQQTPINRLCALRAQVSGWFVMTTADVRRIAGPWLRFSEDVRLDPEVTLTVVAVCVSTAACRCGSTPTSDAGRDVLGPRHKPKCQASAHGMQWRFSAGCPSITGHRLHRCLT